MARSRLLKPGFFTNDLLGEMEPRARLLYAGLWCLADREGRLEDRPARIRVEILPYDADADVDALLGTLSQRGFVKRYSVRGQRLIELPSFKSHQTINPREAESHLPGSDESDTDESTGEPRNTDESVTGHEQVGDLRSEMNGSELEEEVKGSEAAPKVPRSLKEKPIPPPQRTEITESFKAAMDVEFRPQLQDFDGQWKFIHNGQYLHGQRDKQSLVRDKLLAAVKREKERSNGTSRSPGPRLVRDPRAEAIAAGFNVDD